MANGKPQLLLTGLIYAAVVFSSIHARGAYFSGHADVVTCMGTIFCFTVYSVMHVSLLSPMCVMRPNMPRMDRLYSWVARFILFWFGFTFFFSYASISRYGTHVFDWVATAGFTLLLFVTTLSSIWVPPEQADHED